jgi:hypothetical protein
MTLLDFALGLAVLYDLGVGDEGIKDYAKRAKRQIDPEYQPLVCLCIKVKKRRQFVKHFLVNLE